MISFTGSSNPNWSNCKHVSKYKPTLLSFCSWSLDCCCCLHPRIDHTWLIQLVGWDEEEAMPSHNSCDLCAILKVRSLQVHWLPWEHRRSVRPCVARCVERWTLFSVKCPTRSITNAHFWFYRTLGGITIVTVQSSPSIPKYISTIGLHVHVNTNVIHGNDNPIKTWVSTGVLRLALFWNVGRL